MIPEPEMRIEVPRGRTLEIRTAGPSNGDVLLFHHGTPGAGFGFGPMEKAAAARGLRMVMYSRPGYGTSTPMPGRKVIDAASDSAFVADAVGAMTFRTIGWSGGGPHALACAAAMPDRCLATVTIAGVAPYRALGLDWFDGMATENIDEFRNATKGEGALTPFLDAFASALPGLRQEDLIESLGGLLSEIDKVHLTGAFAEYLLESLRIGLATGSAGHRDDDLAFVRDWGFDLRNAKRVAIWQGAHDRMVPYAHGIWLADHIPGARRRLLDTEGHLSIVVGMFDRILDDLLDLAP